MLDLIQRFFGFESEQKPPESRSVSLYKLSMKEWRCRGCKESFLYKSIRCPICESVEIDETEVPTSYGLRFRKFN